MTLVERLSKHVPANPGESAVAAVAARVASNNERPELGDVNG